MPPPLPLVALRDAGVHVDRRPIFAGISAALGAGDRVCLVGRNGAGKSTLLKALAGEIELDAGERFVQPGARIAYMPQTPVLDPALDAAAYVALGLPRGEDGRHRVEQALDEVGMAPGKSLAALSGGEGRRVSLARALVGDPDILLLDEPTNHLDIAAVEALEERLAGTRAGLLLISHDRAFLNRLSQRTLWLDRGSLREHDRGYAYFEEWSEGILEAEAAAAARLDKRIAAETVWSRQGISARRKRNQGRLRRLYALRDERAQRRSLDTVKMGAGAVDTGGKIVFEMEKVSKAFAGPDGASTPIVRDFSTRIVRGDRVGIIGRNGAGKSTLIGLLTGEIAADSEVVKRGTNLQFATFDQMRASLDPAASLWDTLAAGGGDFVSVRGERRHVTSYLKDFLFDDRQFRAKVSTLSGGERNRLLLARVLAQPSNVLILDEPTNDLDLETLGLLEEVLGDYDGTLLLVSHDRDFLDRVVTSTIAMEGEGVAHEYVGGYSDYLRQRRAPLAVAAKAVAREEAKVVAAPRERVAVRLSYKEQRELDGLPGKIAALEAEKVQLETALADPGRDRASLPATLKRHAALLESLAEAEHRWLTLAERAEELARAKAG